MYQGIQTGGVGGQGSLRAQEALHKPGERLGYMEGRGILCGGNPVGLGLEVEKHGGEKSCSAGAWWKKGLCGCEDSGVRTREALRTRLRCLGSFQGLYPATLPPAFQADWSHCC